MNAGWWVDMPVCGPRLAAAARAQTPTPQRCRHRTAGAGWPVRRLRPIPHPPDPELWPLQSFIRCLIVRPGTCSAAVSVTSQSQSVSHSHMPSRRYMYARLYSSLPTSLTLLLAPAQFAVTRFCLLLRDFGGLCRAPTPLVHCLPPTHPSSIMKLLCPRWRVAPPPTALCACRPGSAATSACSPVSTHTHLALALSSAPSLQSRGFSLQCDAPPVYGVALCTNLTSRPGRPGCAPGQR